MEMAKKKAFRMYCLGRDVSMHDVIDAFVDEVLAGQHGELIERVKRGKGSL
jgi:hypothetical protein